MALVFCLSLLAVVRAHFFVGRRWIVNRQVPMRQQERGRYNRRANSL